MQEAVRNEKRASYELPPMRTIKQAIAEIKQADPNTPMSEWALRKLVVDGIIPSVKAGTKYLINMKILEEYMYKGTYSVKEETKEYGKIRAVKE